MNKRFMLTTAGAAATGIAGLASAELVDFTHEMDRWAGEHAWQVFSSGGATVASMAIVSSSLFYAGASSLSIVTYSATSSHFATVTGVLDLASGTYNVQMQDSYGDGWSWGSFVGGLAIGSGSASISGASASFSFTVAGVPAPGALALLGLAGVAGSRRRK
ncbi:MAG: PEP-CTERM sorting domain-containing protein [Phycisphaerales bacterium]|nr:PEP-CTERM sorting domain-containing protein [Phycisphaerales bacterium]